MYLTVYLSIARCFCCPEIVMLFIVYHLVNLWIYVDMCIGLLKQIFLYDVAMQNAVVGIYVFCIILFMSYSFVKQSTCWKSHSLWFIIQIRMISFISIKLVGYPVPDVLYEFRSIPLVLSSLYLCCYMIVSYIYWWYIVINLEKYLCAIFKLLYISLLYFPIIKNFINFGVLLYS